MIIVDSEYGKFETSLVDDGTLDTVVNVVRYAPNGFHIMSESEIRFLTEYAAEYRDKNGTMTDKGFETLSEEAVEAYIEQYCID